MNIGAELNAGAAEPPAGSVVRDRLGVRWCNSGRGARPWTEPDSDDRETWPAIAGTSRNQYGPVVVERWGY